jgi:hypothetical protein
MADLLLVDLFAEDEGHERFISAILLRMASELNRTVDLRIRSARGGHGRAITELEQYQRRVEKGLGSLERPNILVIAIDANCSTFHKMRQQIEDALIPSFRDLAVIACPDPHIERWYLVDAPAFAASIGPAPTLVKYKCAKDRYKRLLTESIRAAGGVTTLGGIEFADDIVPEMDWYRAGKSDASLGAFLGDLRACLLRQ